ncbi:hypothetical protein L1987_60023 [Smallanthus sonchifolius]|uniref:Uncharacterized protein n=1 Tax=Smallanthus sonchifolius TaxID=185202 RepID=A0ACB9D6V5_9ASTR|nr:hypothetical protein L1987_60023 [Smallanthus sonchifolius]
MRMAHALAIVLPRFGHRFPWYQMRERETKSPGINPNPGFEGAAVAGEKNAGSSGVFKNQRLRDPRQQHHRQ